MSLYFLLDKDKNPFACSVKEWADWINHNSKHVRHTIIKKYGVRISTVFLGIDHNHFSQSVSKPLLFETMVFLYGNEDLESNLRGYMERYCTWDEALKGHREAVKWVIAQIREKEANNCTNCNGSGDLRNGKKQQAEEIHSQVILPYTERSGDA